MILWVILIAIFSHFVFDVFLQMTFSLKKVTKIIDRNLYCILLGISHDCAISDFEPNPKCF